MARKLLDVPHRQQNNDGDCLSAKTPGYPFIWCASLQYPTLDGFHIRRHLQPNRYEWGYAYLDRGLPVIVFVRTQKLPCWSYGVDHALLVVGYDDASVFVNDPDLSEPNKRISTGDFELAWLERDYFYAVISTIR